MTDAAAAPPTDAAPLTPAPDATEAHDTDVLIVGAGPVGLVLAVDLARRGVGVRIIDELAAPTTQSRAIVINSRSLDHLDALGLFDELDALGRRASGNVFHSGARTIATVPLDRNPAVHPFSLSVAQTDTEAVLTRRADDLGVRVERSSTVESYDDRGDRVVVVVVAGDGARRTFRAKFLVGADGARSAVRALTGQRLEGSFAGEQFLLGDVTGRHPYDPTRFHTFFSPSKPTGLLFPLRGDRVRVFAQLPPGTDPSRPATVEWLQDALDERGIDLQIHTTAWVTRFEIKHGQVPQYRSGRVFLAGDAAHIHSPAGGLGMNTGIQDAMNLSWKLAWTLARGGSDALLDSYQSERHPIAHSVITFTTRLSRMGTLHNAAARRIRNTLMGVAVRIAPLANRLAAVVEQLNVRYRASPITAGTGATLRPGDFLHLPETTVAHALARTPGHLAILLPGTGPALIPPGVELFVIAPTDAGYLSRAVGLRHGVVVVRPDGYIGCIAADVARALDAYTEALNGTSQIARGVDAADAESLR